VLKKDLKSYSETYINYLLGTVHAENIFHLKNSIVTFIPGIPYYTIVDE
jgi:hypothetical protein